MIVIKNAKIGTRRMTLLSFVVLFAIISVPLLYAQEPGETGCPCDFDMSMLQNTVALEGESNVACLDEATFDDAQKIQRKAFHYNWHWFWSKSNKVTQKEQAGTDWTVDFSDLACSVTITDDNASITTKVSELTAEQIDACTDIIEVVCDLLLN